MKLYPHQETVLKQTEHQNKVAYYLDMGLGKTFVGGEKMLKLDARIDLIVCQKSKIEDWINHCTTYYRCNHIVLDLTNKKEFEKFINMATAKSFVPYPHFIGVINYDLIWHRAELSKLKYFTLMLDESSLIQNESAKRSKFILKKLKPTNVILLSGTPTSGKYERLWSQMHLLGWKISKKMYYSQYIDIQLSNEGYPIIKGYKNVERLKLKMREHGCVFMKSDEVLNLPTQNFITINSPESKEYKKFKKSGIVELSNGVELVGDTTLTKLLYSRYLCGFYNDFKLKSCKDLIESTEDRLIIFYNFNQELSELISLAEKCNKLYSVVNGKTKNLDVYEKYDDSITFVQYQAGAMGLNLQKANKVIYFTPPLSTELFEQSKKRTHRIGQNKACFYYQLTSGIEYKIYSTLEIRKDFTDALFEEVINDGTREIL